jgi:hypothetical protein
MTQHPAPKAAAPSFSGQIQPDDPTATHDLEITITCADETAAYNIMMEIASKMRLQCHGLDNLPENRSLPAAGTVINLVTRGPAEHKVGTAVVSMSSTD